MESERGQGTSVDGRVKICKIEVFSDLFDQFRFFLYLIRVTRNAQSLLNLNV